MFRRLPSSLPKDPVFPTNLDELGYFVNDRDQIRYKKRPELDFIFNINKNDRFNEMQRESMNQCIRDILRTRFEKLGLITLRLPFPALPSEPHVPILVSPDLGKKSRIIVFFGEPFQDLGVLAYRVIGTNAIYKGSIEEFVKGILEGKANGANDKDTPGIVIANPGQLVWHRGGARAITLTSWLSIPRKSAVHDSMRLDPVKNRVPGNEDVDKHVEFIFEKVLGSLASPKAKLDVIAMEWSTTSVVRYLNKNWSKLSSNISTLITGAPQYDLSDIRGADNESTAFADFVSGRSRAYIVCPEALETPVEGRNMFGCNCYASGEDVYSERVMTMAWRSMFNWLSMVHSVDGFEEIEMLMSTEIPPGIEELMTTSAQTE